METDRQRAHGQPPWLAELGSPLLTDLYQLTMLRAYVNDGMYGEAVFEFFVRRLPEDRNFLLVAGLEQLVDFLETLHFSDGDLAWLEANGHADAALLDYLRGFRFSGSLDALPEGSIAFADEPIARITARLPEAQLVESRLVNLLNFQTLIATKAARSVLVAGGRLLVDFGMRRAHGSEAALLAARAAHLAGFDGTATVLAGKLFGVPVYGTMAHSFVQAHDSESEAFAHFARTLPDGVVLLIDTWDTLQGARNVVELLPRLHAAGIEVRALRLDSGDLSGLSRAVRDVLDAAGAPGVRLFASGGLNEAEIQRLIAAGAPIDGFGVGTDLDVSADAPKLDCAYKLQEYAGRARRKRSAGKATWPGRKQVYRRFGHDGRLIGDTIALESESAEGTPLLRPVMRGGRRLEAPEALADLRARAAASLASLPDELRSLVPGPAYPVAVSAGIRELAARVDRADTSPART